ncbi:MAG TPA: uroporphyrinogen-III synthase [Xanthobacteraceae bacterium]|nr:uroporphyrinogen-III synthase [Xanthobacteraceae bacterium]
MRLLVTRPEPECERTAALLRERGHEVLRLPLLRIEPVADAELGAGPWAAVLFTSANAVQAVAVHSRFRELATLPVYTVGRRTKAAAIAAGFASVASADGDVNALIRLVASKRPTASSRPLLYCAGKDRAGDLAGALQVLGLSVETAVVYRAVMVDNLPIEVRAAFVSGAIDAVLHYSARTAAAFATASARAGIGDLSTQARHLCLSAQVAAPLEAAGAKAIEVASEPNEQALLALIGRT